MTKYRRRKKPISASTRASLIFPVGRMATFFRKGHYSPRLSKQSAIAMASVLEFLVYEILDLSAEVVKQKKKQRIFPVHIIEACKLDPEIKEMFYSFNIQIGINKDKKKKRYMNEEMV